MLARWKSGGRQEERREAAGARWLDSLQRNLHYAFRLLARSPVFTFTVIATLALCTGANTAIFSVVNAVVFRALPYPAPERLASIATLHRSGGQEYEQTEQDGKAWEFVRDHVHLLDVAVQGGTGGVNLFTLGVARYVAQQRVSAGFFRVLGVPPFIGREFTRAEDQPGGPAVAILSNALWVQNFQSDPNIIGRSILLKGEPHRVIGVMPPGFQVGMEQQDVWTPLRPGASGEGGGSNYHLIARIAAGTTWAQADAELASLSPALFPARPDAPQSRLRLMPLLKGWTESVRLSVYLLWSAVALVLLIGCLNIMGLLLARSGTRVRELATRMALGSGRSAVVHQLLTESFLLAGLGALCGLGLGWFALGAIREIAPAAFHLPASAVVLDWRVFAASIGTALLASLLFGLYPALKGTRIEIRTALVQGSSRGASSAHRDWPRRVLVLSGIALSFALLVGAGLLIRTFLHLSEGSPGFDPANVTAATLSLDDARYATSAAFERFVAESLRKIREVRGVEAAGMGLTLPFVRSLNDGIEVIDGPASSTGGQITNFNYITPGYCEALRIRLLRGRYFAGSDTAMSEPVAIVNPSFVRKYLSGTNASSNAGLNPLDIHLRSGKSVLRIVGVVADVPQGAGWGGFAPLASVPTVYVPAAQTDDNFRKMVHTWYLPAWVVRTRGPVPGLGNSLQQAISTIDPQLPFAEVEALTEVRNESLAFQRSIALLLTALAALAILLAAVGLYGLMANSVVERTREIGIRLALGSTQRKALLAVTAPGLQLTVLGLLAGAALSFALTRLLRGLIWGVAPADPVTFAGVAALLLCVAAVASAIPASRVLAIDPAESLRDE